MLELKDSSPTTTLELKIGVSHICMKRLRFSAKQALAGVRDGASRARLTGSSIAARFGLFPLLSGHYDVPVVLHCIVSPSGEQPCYHRPLVAVHTVGRQKLLLLFFREGPPINPGI